LEEARELLTQAVDGFDRAGFRLEAWHLAAALAEAEHRCAAVDAAGERLQRVVVEAEAASAFLASRIARETAARLGITIAPHPATAEPVAAARIPTGERMVSVLFADVRGYTELSGRAAPADIAGRIASLQRWAVQEVGRRNGIVDKFAGDAVMATFNVSGQSVDHTLQAFRAAVGIVDKASLAGLGVGASVAVGPAVVGNLAESANVSVLGEVTNLASRLQAVAGAGEIMLSDEVYRRVKEWLDGQQIRAERLELELKGFPAPVFAYKVTTGTVVAASV
jgi:adenylate cyclase